MLNYCLVKNPLNSDRANYIAYVSSLDTKNLDDVIDYMVAEGSGLTRPQALAYFEKLTQTMLRFVGEGHTVTTPLFRIRPSITGVFESRIDSFDPSRHHVNIRTSAGVRLRAFSENIKLKKTTVKSQDPVLNTFFDSETETNNKKATVGGIAVLHGKRLRFDPKDNQQGIFFSPVGSPKKEIRASSYSGVKPSEVYFLLPSLEQGAYFVIAKTKTKNSKFINIGKLSDPITF